MSENRVIYPINIPIELLDSEGLGVSAIGRDVERHCQPLNQRKWEVDAFKLSLEVYGYGFA